MTKKKSSEKDEKSEMITIRISPYDKELIERTCKKDGLTVSQYIIGCIHMDMLTSGDAEMMKRALAIVGNGFRIMSREVLFGKKTPEDAGELKKTLKTIDIPI